MDVITVLYERKPLELIEVRVFCSSNLGKIISFEEEMQGRLNNLSRVSYNREDEDDVIFVDIELVGEMYAADPEAAKAILYSELREKGYNNLKVI